MLQQTPVVRVQPRWEEWMDRWPTPADLAAATPAEVLRAWDRLGYPRRALRLHACAQAVVDRHDGAVPTEEAALLALPGVGTYTAAAVAAFAHGRRSVVVDTNVRRVLTRTLDGEALPPPHLSAGELRRAGELVPEDDATSARWNAAVMELGAVVCTARSPRCEACPVREQCGWLAAGRPADLHVLVRRRQAWEGTDRQVRGRVMARLRAADHPVPGAVLEDVTLDAEQRARVLAGLLLDGLVEKLDDGYRLPG
ncbi:A/G-specific adenine glycosylase [Actinotalea sp. BY-33]|uniref:A/G-specific adenine glycosylase n=2 Tax=Actinotalea soli TaxID=2819234 RepID=A0A939RX98_9CELL|nr:A/G-specific adenine glycosylase [Actinotalea soli]